MGWVFAGGFGQWAGFGEAYLLVSFIYTSDETDRLVKVEAVLRID
jgi:hypothetical protein